MKKKEIFSNIKDYNQIDIMVDFQFILELGMFIAMSKGNYYQDSWCKRGLFSISQNLERKWDRIENMLFGINNEDGLLQGNLQYLQGESIIDNLMDLGIYCFLAVVWFWQQGKKNNFEESLVSFNNFVNNANNFIKENFPVYSYEKNISPKNLFSDFHLFIQNKVIDNGENELKKVDSENKTEYMVSLYRKIIVQFITEKLNLININKNKKEEEYEE